MKYYNCKISYTEVDEATKKETKVKTSVVFDAINYTEAEARCIAYAEKNLKETLYFCIDNIGKVEFYDVFPVEIVDSCGKNDYCGEDISTEEVDLMWHKATVVARISGEEEGSFKDKKFKVLVQAIDLTDAQCRVEEAFDYDNCNFTVENAGNAHTKDVVLHKHSKEL